MSQQIQKLKAQNCQEHKDTGEHLLSVSCCCQWLVSEMKLYKYWILILNSHHIHGNSCRKGKDWLLHTVVAVFVLVYTLCSSPQSL